MPLSVIDLHPQAATVDFIAAKTRIAVTRGNGARTGIDQIVAADPSAVALRQPFRKFDETPVGQVLDALITAKRRLLSIEAKLIAEIPEDQFRVCLADGRLTVGRDEFVDFPDLVSDIPELTGDAHFRTFMPPVKLVGRGLVRKLPKISTSSQEDGGADQFAGADIAFSVTDIFRPIGMSIIARSCGIERSRLRLGE